MVPDSEKTERDERNVNSAAPARDLETSVWGQLGDWKYIERHRSYVALEFNILEPLIFAKHGA